MTIDDYKDEIEKTKRLHEIGVNFAGPISQIKFDDRHVIVEEYLAKGITMEDIKEQYKFDSSLNSNQILIEYEKFFSTYFEEIKIRAKANQELYDKLFNDIIEMNKENLTLDTCSLGNLFFDKNVGFSIIDAYPGNNVPDVKLLFWMIKGNIPSIECIDNNQSLSNCVPKEFYDEFMNYINIIINKLTMAAQKLNIDFNYDDLKINPNVVTINTIDKMFEMEKNTNIRIFQ